MPRRPTLSSGGHKNTRATATDRARARARAQLSSVFIGFILFVFLIYPIKKLLRFYIYSIFYTFERVFQLRYFFFNLLCLFLFIFFAFWAKGI